MATPEQRSNFVNIFRDSLLDTYAETLAQWGDSTISTNFPDKLPEDGVLNIEVKQTLDTGTSKYPISYKLRKSSEGWKIVNIIINGVNLGLTFRNQFQALAKSHDENIEATLKIGFQMLEMQVSHNMKEKLKILSKKIYLMRFASLKVIHVILNYKYRRKYFPQ